MGEIRIRVFAVLRLYDRYRGLPVRDGLVSVTAEPKMKVLYKEGGYAVLLEEPGVEVAEITIRSHVFTEQVLTVRRQDPVIEEALWLEANRRYPFLPDTVFVSGNADAGAYLSFKKEEKEVRLTADYIKGSKEIRLYGLPPQAEGMEYIFWEKDEQVSRPFKIAKCGEGRDGICLLKDPVEEDFFKNKICVRRVYQIPVCGDKSFFMAFHMPGIKGNEGYVLQGKRVKERFLMQEEVCIG